MTSPLTSSLNTTITTVSEPLSAQSVAPNSLLQGYLWGFAGVVMFSGGIPATRAAVQSLPFLFVGTGRAVVAALLSILLLLILRQRIPAREHWPALALVALGAVFVYPTGSAIAMQYLAAGHGTLITSVMPLFTAMFGAWFANKWPKAGFWCCALLGSGAVIFYASLQGHGALQWADIILMLSCLCCGMSYAKGAQLAKHLGSWQVICWALVLSLPLLLPIVLLDLPDMSQVTLSSWLGFGYLSVFSMFLGFIAWYRGLSLGGVVHVSQLQLLTPFLALTAASLLLGEALDPWQWLVSAFIIGTILLGRKLS